MFKIKNIILNSLDKCRIMYIIRDFSDISTKHSSLINLINLVKQILLYTLHAVLLASILFMVWILLWVVCALNDQCYYSYMGV